MVHARTSRTTSSKIGLTVIAAKDNINVTTTKPYSNWLRTVSKKDILEYGEFYYDIALDTDLTKVDMIKYLSR